MNNRNSNKCKYRATRVLIKSMRNKLDYMEEILNQDLSDSIKLECLEELGNEIISNSNKVKDYFSKDSTKVVRNDKDVKGIK